MFYMMLISLCYGCSYASTFDLWAVPIGECFTDDDTPPGSYILSCDGSATSLMTYSNSDCSGTGTPYTDDIEFGTLVCDHKEACNIGRISSYRPLNDSNCNDRNKWKHSNVFVLDKCIPTDGGFGSNKAGYASCDSSTNTLTIQWYYDIDCQNMSDTGNFTNECVYNDWDNSYQYTEIQCGSSTNPTSNSPRLGLHWAIYCLSIFMIGSIVRN